MINAHRRIVSYATSMTLVTALVFHIGFVTSTSADEPTSGSNENWEDVSSAFTKEIGAHDMEDPAYDYLRRCIGLIVTPNGDIVIQTNKGVCVSRDQGTTWSVVADSKITGRCEHGFGFSIPYPYDGRMVFFCCDGTGGLSLDDGKTWKPFGVLGRAFELGDVDWNTHDPQTIIALTHEPYFSVLSNDGGKSWQRLNKDETGSGPEAHYSVGIIDGKTLMRGTQALFAYPNGASSPENQDGVIELSQDAGQTWTQVANYQVTGRRPVHYGRHVYWTTPKGVITSSNGKDWTLTGPGAEGACYGPYFGSSEQEFVVVTDKNFLKTEDGGKTWKPIAKIYIAPDIFHGLAWHSYFGWDPKHNILYASGLGASVYRLKL
jgi:hypothetical protein